MLFSRNEL